MTQACYIVANSSAVQYWKVYIPLYLSDYVAQ